MPDLTPSQPASNRPDRSSTDWSTFEHVGGGQTYTVNALPNTIAVRYPSGSASAQALDAELTKLAKSADAKISGIKVYVFPGFDSADQAVTHLVQGLANGSASFYGAVYQDANVTI